MDGAGPSEPASPSLRRGAWGTLGPGVHTLPNRLPAAGAGPGARAPADGSSTGVAAGRDARAGAGRSGKGTGAEGSRE